MTAADLRGCSRERRRSRGAASARLLLPYRASAPADRRPTCRPGETPGSNCSRSLARQGFPRERRQVWRPTRRRRHCADPPPRPTPRRRACRRFPPSSARRSPRRVRIERGPAGFLSADQMRLPPGSSARKRTIQNHSRVRWRPDNSPRRSDRKRCCTRRPTSSGGTTPIRRRSRRSRGRRPRWRSAGPNNCLRWSRKPFLSPRRKSAPTRSPRPKVPSVERPWS